MEYSLAKCDVDLFPIHLLCSISNVSRCAPRRQSKNVKMASFLTIPRRYGGWHSVDCQSCQGITYGSESNYDLTITKRESGHEQQENHQIQDEMYHHQLRRECLEPTRRSLMATC
jgi:hypothetical protein